MGKIEIVLLTFLTVMLFFACKGEKMPMTNSAFSSIESVPVASWEKLAQKKIYFGHQSVGYNILDGIRDVMKEHPGIKLNIVETTDLPDSETGIFAHSTVGRNVDPKSKIDGFVKLINAGIGRKADFSALKFCFVDINAETNVRDIMRDYHANMEKLKKEFPKMTIVHFTVPLMSSKTTWKTLVKKLIGRKTWEYDDNIKRNEYNDMLRKRYAGNEPIFDLAGVESTYPDGTRCTFTKDGKTYYSMVPKYTNDGGHLNDLGRKIVAEQLLISLANLCK